MANIVLDFLHNYQTGERRETEPANAYQYDEGHVLEAVLPEVITSAEIHYWIRGMEEADAYESGSITPNSDGSCTVLGNIPNKYFETNGELRIYIVVTDGTASITTYEGKLHICQRSMPDDYVDDDPENEATRILTEVREAAERCEEVLESIPSDYSQLSEDVDTLKGELGDLSDLETTDKSNIVAAINEAAHSGGNSLTTIQKQTLMDVVNIIGAFTVSDAQDYIDAFNEAWNVTVTGIRLNKSSITFDGFGSEQLRAILIPEDATGTVTWVSSNSNVATVSSNGLVEPVANGSCTITASCAGFTASCSVTAINIPQTFTITTSLSNCTASNSQATAVEGSSYSNTITANQGYEMSAITCTMGGVAQTVSDGVINIAEVTGNIVINATATAEATYTSSTGKTYTKRFTYDNNGDSTPYKVSSFISEYGVMSELEELTLGGNIHDASSATTLNGAEWATNYPNLKRLIIAPDAVYSNRTTMNTVMKCGTHYVFSKIPSSLVYIQLGKVNQNYYVAESKYFRGDGSSAGLSSDTSIGNTNGLTLVIYASQYLAKGGFMGTLEATTTVEEYLYTDGSVLTA